MKEKIQPSFYAIIPATVRYDKDLNPNAKLLYGEITALCKREGYCWASNSYFAELYGVSKVTISRWVKNLIDKGYIVSDIKYKEGSKEIKERRLYLNDTLPINKNDKGSYQNCNEGINKNDNTPINKNVKGINTDNIITSINTDNKEYGPAKAEPSIPYKKIIEYLNSKTGRQFNFKGQANRRLIKARFNEGYTEDDFYKVIDIKTEEWTNTDMEKYLRPNTLFGNKFDGYLNQEPVEPVKEDKKSKEDSPYSFTRNGIDPTENPLEYYKSLIE